MDKPITSPDGAGWEALFQFAAEPPSNDFTVYAYCFDNSPNN